MAQSDMAKSGDRITPLQARRGGRCPLCGKPVRLETRPFCSQRCRDVDLARWLGGTYVIPGAAPAETGEAETLPDDDSFDKGV